MARGVNKLDLLTTGRCEDVTWQYTVHTLQTDVLHSRIGKIIALCQNVGCSTHISTRFSFRLTIGDTEANCTDKKHAKVIDARQLKLNANSAFARLRNVCIFEISPSVCAWRGHQQPLLCCLSNRCHLVSPLDT